MSRLIRSLAVAAASAAVITPAVASAADDPPPPKSAWSFHVDKTFTARQLGLPPGATRAQMARAAVKRSAPQLGIPAGRLGTLRSVADPGARGGVSLRQSLGGLRVVFSQLHVVVRQGSVRGISGTAMPLRSNRLAGRVRISARRAQAIARNRVAGPDTATSARLVAYAGAPDRPRAPRRAYVVAVDPANASSTEDSPTPVCVVVDAASGKVLATWKGTIVLGESKPPVHASGPGARAAQSSQTVLARHTSRSDRRSR